MDPLSIVASTITIASVAAALVKSLEKLIRLRGASSELLSLMNDVTDLNAVLQEFGTCVKDDQKRLTLSLDYQADLLQRGKNTLLELDSIVHYELIKPGPGEIRVSHKNWLRKCSSIKRLQEDIKDIKINLLLVSGSITLRNFSRVDLRLDEVSSLLYDLRQQSTTQQILARKFLESISDQTLDPLPSSNTSFVSAPALRREGAPAGYAQRISWTNEAGEGTIQTSVDSTAPAPFSALKKTNSTIRTQASQYRRTCQDWCSCNCHRRSVLSSPAFFHQLIGSMFIGYTAFPMYGTKCTVPNCAKQTANARLTYYFPRWIMSRMLCMTFSNVPSDVPRVSLSLPRVIEGNADIMRFAVSGNLDGIKSLFKQGLASPYDVVFSTGRTALHYAVVYNHVEVSQFLIDQGADKSIEDKQHQSTVALAWSRILGNLVDLAIVEAFKHRFYDEDHLESRQFSSIHKIVLGLFQVDLSLQLKLSPSLIDSVDSNGRTPLTWAAMRGDLAAMQSLLDAGADPNSQSNDKQTPIHWAAQATSSSAGLHLLLARGAEADIVDRFQRTALIYASCNQNDESFLEPLLRGHVNINKRDCHDRTALGYAAKMNRTRTLVCLLDHGADPYIPDHEGYTPLLEAILGNRHGIIEILLNRNITCTARAKGGRTLLHLATLHGDMRTMRLLHDAGLTNMRPSELDDAGLSPQDLLHQRDNPELVSAFDALLIDSDRQVMEESDSCEHDITG